MCLLNLLYARSSTTITTLTMDCAQAVNIKQTGLMSKLLVVIYYSATELCVLLEYMCY